MIIFTLIFPPSYFSCVHIAESLEMRLRTFVPDLNKKEFLLSGHVPFKVCPINNEVFWVKVHEQ